jgi:hypothetical protein
MDLNSENLKKNIGAGKGVLDGADEMNQEVLVLYREDRNVIVGLEIEEQGVFERFAEIIVVTFFFVEELFRFELFVPAVYFGMVAVAGIVFCNYPGLPGCICGSGNIGHATGAQSKDRI